MALFNMFGNNGCNLSDAEKNKLVDRAKDCAGKEDYAKAWDIITGNGKFAFDEVWYNFREAEIEQLLTECDEFMESSAHEKRCTRTEKNAALYDSIKRFEKRYWEHQKSRERAEEFAKSNKNAAPAPKSQPRNMSQLLKTLKPQLDEDAEKEKIDAMVHSGDLNAVYDKGCEYWADEYYELGFYCYRKLALEKHLLGLQTCAEIMENGQMPLDKKEYGLWMGLIAMHPELPDSERAKYQYDCGKIYLQGRDVVKDVDEAIFWFTNFIQNEFANPQQVNEAIFTLGTIFKDEGAVRDMKMCLYWMERAAENGNTEAMEICAQMYKEGKGTPVNTEKYLYWLDKLAQKGDVEAMYQYADQSIRGDGYSPKNMEKIIKYLVRASEQGHAGADVSIGYLAFWNKQYEKALFFYKRAADKNYLDGIKGVLTLYEEKKVEYSFTDYLKYAEDLVFHKEIDVKGKTLVAKKLGLEYYMGENGVEDISKAVRMLTIAAENGDSWAMGILGAIYKTEDEVKDEDKAFSWLKKSAEGGVVLSMKLLADKYFDGKGTIQNYDKSFYWEKRAAELGDADSMYKTGINYYYGVGTKKDIEQAKAWMFKAVQSDDKETAKLAEEFMKEKDLI